MNDCVFDGNWVFRGHNVSQAVNGYWVIVGRVLIWEHIVMSG